MAENVGICPQCLSEFSADQVNCPDHGVRLIGVDAGVDPRIGMVIDDKLTITAQLGQGGMGTVYRAIQHSMHREVAVKLLRKSFSEDITVVRRFLQEARATSSLNHPNVITLIDFGQTSDGELYIVMELLTGRPLSELLRAEGALDAQRAVGLVAQICDALQAAHEMGVIHRDLKPDNIFVMEGAGQHGEFIKVLDFGIAKLTQGPQGTALTAAGSVCGTPTYMSPEQARGGDVDARSDVYSAAIVLYEMLAGRPPFSGETPAALLLSHVRDTPRSLRDARPDVRVPAEVEAHLMRALAKDPDRRAETALAFKVDLVSAIRSFQANPTTTSLENVDTLEGVGVPQWDSPSEPLDTTIPAKRVQEADADALGATLPAAPISSLPNDVQTSGAMPLTRRKWLIPVLLVAAGVGAFYAADLFETPDEAEQVRADTPPESQLPQSPPVESTERVWPEPAKVDPPTPLPEKNEAAAPEATAPPDSEPLPAARSEDLPAVQVVSVPSGATVLLAGKKIGVTPTKVSLPAEGSEMKLVIRRKGYKSIELDLTSQTKGPIKVELKKPRRSRPKGPDLVP